MQKLIKDGSLIDDSWNILKGTEISSEQSIGNWILPLDIWLNLNEQQKIDYNIHGVWLSSDSDVSVLSPYTNKLKLIAVDFPAFADGRGFSIARSLREQLDFSGEVRAIGHFMEDQVYYLMRCGFNAFKMEDECNLDSMLERFSDFSDSYQAGVDEPQPLFRRRA